MKRTCRGTHGALAPFVFMALALAACNSGTSTPEDAGEMNNSPDTGGGSGSKGFIIAPNTGLKTTERGGQASFAVALAGAPTAAVRVAVSSSNPAEGTASPPQLTFTPENWAAPQTVTVSGVDDQVRDGDVTFTVVLAPATSDGADFNGQDPSDVSVTNLDDETQGITIVSTGSLTTSEAGGQATFAVLLNSRPKANVTIALASSTPAEGTVSPASLTFTPDNWNAPQVVTVTGVDDAALDGPQMYAVVTAPAQSADSDYSGLNTDDPPVTNTDDESAGFTIAAAPNLTTSEAGEQATFTIALSGRPGADVTIALSSSDPSEATVAPASLTFTVANWNAPQSVTVTGVDDSNADGNQVYKVVTAAAVSLDPRYAGLDPNDVSLSNIDNDSAGITVSATSVDTTEAGGSRTFTVALNSQPTSDVVILLASSDATEGVAAPASLVFTATNWKAPQTVTVTGVDDTIADGTQPYTINLKPAGSADGRYQGLDPADVTFTNIDNDSAGVTVAAGVLTTTEGSGTASFTVVLNSQPAGSVTIPISSSNTAEGTVSPSTLTFTQQTWSTPQTVTVRGVNDDVKDGNQVFSVVTGATSSSDSTYNGLVVADVVVTNNDNDTAGVIVARSGGGTTTTEGGGSDTFTIVLRSKPTSDVTIMLASDDVTEVTILPAAFTFTPANWSTPQTATLTGVDDARQDGNQPFSIITSAAASADATYNGLVVDDLPGLNVDNDTAGFIVTETGGVTTTNEGALFDDVTIELTSQPAANVVINVASSNVAEATVNTPSLTFTPNNWSVPQTVRVTGVDDLLDDNTAPYSIVLTIDAAGTEDPLYDVLNPPDVSASNEDNDTAGFAVLETGGATITTEAGGSDTFTVVLNAEPVGTVVVNVTSANTGEGTVNAPSLTFGPGNWSVPQTVTVTGANDLLDDGDLGYTIQLAVDTVLTTDPIYDLENPADVSVTNTDNDTAGFTVTQSGGSTVTTEALAADTFTVVLNTQPTGDVVVNVTSGDVSEGTVGAPTLTFTTSDWNIAQTVTVTGVDDALDDGDVGYTVQLSVNAALTADAVYDLENPADVSATNTDNDTAGFTVTQTGGSTVTTEALASDTFTVVLNTQPTGDVVVDVTSGNTNEGTVGAPTLTFTTSDWNIAQTVTVTGVNDALDDGDVGYTVQLSVNAALTADAVYDLENPADVSATNTDNDTAGFTITEAGGSTVTTEAGAMDTFTVVLNTQPTGDVVVNVASGDTSEGTVGGPTLTFTTSDWNIAQTVTVTGVNDALDDGDVGYTVQLTVNTILTTDAVYDLENPADVSATNTDNDTAGFTITEAGGSTVTTEAGAMDTFTVVLNTQPTGDVVVNVASGDTSEGTVGGPTLTFTTSDWNIAQTVTVTGVNDALDDGDVGYTVQLTVNTILTTDAVYDLENPADVSATNTDDDTAGFTVTESGGSTVTTEAGGTDSFTVVLNTQPTGNVVVNVTSSNTSEGTVSAPTLTFTTGNWNMAQTITVTGVNDNGDDGDVGYNVQLAVDAALTADTLYDAENPADVSATNTDNDTAGFTVTESGGSTVTTEAGGTDSFTVVLNTQPTGNVVVNVTSSDTSEGTVSAPTLTFTTGNWNMAQTITVTGVNDNGDDGDIGYNVQLAVDAALTADTLYDAENPADVAATNTDNDTAGFTITESGGTTVTTEAGGTDTFTVVLNTQPTGDVVVNVASSNTSEGTVSAPTLTFTTANWNMAQTITVTGVDDLAVDGTVGYTVQLTVNAGSTNEAVYDLENPADVSATNTDNDAAIPTEIRFFAADYMNNDGDMGGRAGADATCQAQASGWAVGKTVHAFLSFSGTDEIRDMPANYSVPTNVPIRNLAGNNTIADDWTDLLDGSIDMSLASAGVLPNGVAYHTGSLTNGAVAVGDNCNGFTDNNVSTVIGDSSATDGDWLTLTIDNCGEWYSLCVAY